MDLGFFSYNVEYGARPDDLARALRSAGSKASGLASTPISQPAGSRLIRAVGLCQSRITIWRTRSFR